MRSGSNCSLDQLPAQGGLWFEVDSWSSKFLAQTESSLAQGRLGEVRSRRSHAAFRLLSSGSKVASCKLVKGVGSPGH